MRDYLPIHPGEILLEEFMVPMGISQYRLAKDIGVPPMRINKIVHRQRGISANTALRLARYLACRLSSGPVFKHTTKLKWPKWT